MTISLISNITFEKQVNDQTNPACPTSLNPQHLRPDLLSFSSTIAHVWRENPVMVQSTSLHKFSSFYNFVCFDHLHSCLTTSAWAHGFVSIYFKPLHHFFVILSSPALHQFGSRRPSASATRPTMKKQPLFKNKKHPGGVMNVFSEPIRGRRFQPDL